MNKICAVVLTAIGIGFGCTESMAGVQVIFSSVPGSPTSVVPLGPALNEAATFRSFSRPYRSPNGTKWMMQASTELRSMQNRVLIVFNGTSAATVLREGQPAPWAPLGETVGFFETRMAINDAGQFCFANRTSGGPTATDLSLVKFDGANYVIEIGEGQPLPGGGTMGGTPQSIGITNDGDVAYSASSSLGGRRCILGGNVVAQVNVTVPANQVNGGTQPINFISGGTFTVSPGGDTLYRAILSGGGVGRIVFVRNGACVVRSEDVLPGPAAVVNDVYFGLETGADHWFVRGNGTPFQPFVMRDGTIIAYSGQPIASGYPENFSTSFFVSQGNSNGDWMVGGYTNNPELMFRYVLTLNGSRVLLRSGAAVDVNNNGLYDDNAYILSFQRDNAFLTNDAAYVNVNLCDNTLSPIGQAFVRVPLATNDPCVADVNNDIAVNVADLLAVIGAWGPCGNCGACPADIAPAGGDCAVNVSDLLKVISQWGGCTPW